MCERDRLLIHAPRVCDEHDEQESLGCLHELNVAHMCLSQRRVLHDRHLIRETRQQAHRARKKVIKVVGAVEKRLNRAPFRSRERLDLRDVVDENAIALVGGNATRRRVGLHNEALFFEHGHVVAYGRRADAEFVPLEQRLRDHRFASRHVIFHDRAEDAELALIHTSHPFAR